MAKFNGLFDFSSDIPMIAFNTDGVDPIGKNVIIRNLSITNYDDAISVKPANKRNKLA